MQHIFDKVRWGIIVFVLGIFGMTSWALFELPDQLLHVYFLDIGQGDSIFIKTPENHKILIDGGPNGRVLNELSEIMPFFDKTIDLIILTHPHADHVGGLIEVLKKYEVKNVLLTGVEYDSEMYVEFLRELGEGERGVFLAKNSSDFMLGDVLFDTFYPFDQLDGDELSNINNSSIVMRVSHGDMSILLTGDLESKAEKELIKTNIELESDIFKAGHHGSRTASTLEFLQRVQPEIVVIQSGEDNKFGHPHTETLENFKEIGVEKIYRNDLDGRIEFVF